jgi:HNH endonuclease
MVTRWSREEIGLEILRMYAVQEPLNYGDVQKNHLRLLRAATRYFGSWKNAVEYAGLDYDRIRRYRVWTTERIIERIQQYHREGRDLSWRHVSTVLDPPLAAAAIRPHRFGSWERALEAAGLDYRTIRRHRRWDPDEVVEELRRLHSEGASLRVTDAAEQCPALVAAARRRFDGWYEAVEAAGLEEPGSRNGLGNEEQRLAGVGR